MDYFRDISKLKAIRSKNPQDWGEFKRLRNKVIYPTINELTSRKSYTPSIKELVVSGVSVSKSGDLANAFNEHFHTVDPKLLIRSRRQLTVIKVVLNILISVVKDSVLLRQIAVKYFYCSQVLLLLNKLSKSKATGLDKISARVPCFLDLTSPAFI